MIRFENVHKSFGHHEVLKGIDAEVDQGQVVCLIGASGSGKSTLLRCVNGLEDYQSGRISVEGETVDAAGPAPCYTIRCGGGQRNRPLPARR